MKDGHNVSKNKRTEMKKEREDKKEKRTFIINGKTYRRKFYAGGTGLLWFIAVFLLAIAPITSKTLELPVAGWILAVVGVILGIYTFTQCWYDDEVTAGDLLGGKGVDPAGTRRVKEDADAHLAELMGPRVQTKAIAAKAELAEATPSK